jgi:hypothetical protein
VLDLRKVALAGEVVDGLAHAARDIATRISRDRLHRSSRFEIDELCGVECRQIKLVGSVTCRTRDLEFPVHELRERVENRGCRREIGRITTGRAF